MPVQYFTRKADIKNPIPSFKYCELCGKKYRPYSNRSHWCSKQCLRRVWNFRWAKKVPFPRLIRRCVWCGNEFILIQRKTTHCGPKCTDEDEKWRRHWKLRQERLTRLQPGKIMGKDEKVASKENQTAKQLHPTRKRILRSDDGRRGTKGKKIGSLDDGKEKKP